MLYKNHKKINLADEPIYKEKQKEFEAFLKGKSSVLFKTHDKLEFNKTGAQEPERTQTISADAVFVDSEGNVDHFIYLEQAPNVLPNGQNDYERVKKPIFVTRVLSVPTTKKDLIFFLMYLCTAAQTKRIFPHNEEAEDRKQVEALSKAANVDYLLTGEYSPVTEPIMRRIAKSLGVSNVDKMSKEKLILVLKSTIDTAEKVGDVTRNTKAFTDAMENQDITAIRAIVMEALDSGKLVFEPLDGAYYYTNEEGAKVKKALTIDMLMRDNQQKRENALKLYYLSNADRLEDLKIVMGYATKDIDFTAVSFQALKKFCATHKLDAKGTAEELAEKAERFYMSNKDLTPIDTTLLLIDYKKKISED